MTPEELKDAIVKELDEGKAENIVVMDVRGKTSITDFMIVASGTSSRHTKSVAEGVSVRMKEQGIKPLGAEGESSSEWVLVDFGDAIVHVMQKPVREFYQLEKLWGFDSDAE